MLSINTVGRTVRVSELQKATGTRTDGTTYENKSIYFTIASDRSYKQKDGTHKSDFIACRANGELAQTIANYASEKKEDNTIVSRLVYLQGSLETYQSKREVDATLKANIGGTNYNVSGKVPVTQDNVIFVVTHLQFLDYKESTKVTTTTTATATATVAVEVAAEGSPNGATAAVSASTTVSGTSPTTANPATTGATAGNAASQGTQADQGVVIGEISAPQANSFDDINSSTVAPF